MAYASDFYIPEHIIGYTGALNRNPTVYFLSRTHYGHITQVHGMWQNVGRETIRSNTQYWFANIEDDRHLYEEDLGAPMTHHSRSPMILVDNGAVPPELTHAIMVHAEQKALRLGAPSVVSGQNIAHGIHPGQQPTDDERSEGGAGGFHFRWQPSRSEGVPPGSRLAAFSR